MGGVYRIYTNVLEGVNMREPQIYIKKSLKKEKMTLNLGEGGLSSLINWGVYISLVYPHSLHSHR